MSSIIAAIAIRGAHKIVEQAVRKFEEALSEKGAEAAVEFPNTGYYIPFIYATLGVPVSTLAEMQGVLDECRRLLPEISQDDNWQPGLDEAVNAGIATIYAEEVIEACKYLIGPNPSQGIWLGAADDIKLRERGLDFVDGSVSGFAAVIGAAPDNATAVKIARELQERNLFVFIAGHTNGVSFAEQLEQEGVQLGWDSRLVPFGKEITATACIIGFAARVAMSFGGLKEGDPARMLEYLQTRIPAFVMALGAIDEEKCANAAAALGFGFPVITDTDVPEIKPISEDSRAQIIANVALDEIVKKSVEARGIKVKITKVPIPAPCSAAFEGERIRREDMRAEFGSTKAVGFELVVMKEAGEVEDDSVEIIGPELDEIAEDSTNSIAVVVEVSGRKMQKDFEPILERQVHRFFNEAQGIFHMGQRDIIWVRVGKNAYDAGFRFEHFGRLLHAKFHDEYSSILDKVQVKIYTEPDKAAELISSAQKIYRERDRRLADMTDEAIDTYYSCTLCQSFAPTHVCVITPERSGLCGAYSWLDGRAAHEITPTGPNQPILKGECLDEKNGQWAGVNKFVYEASGKTIERMSAYSMVVDPMTSCGCFECISAILPSTNGIMTVDRDHPDMTPCGMKFSTLAGSVGGGNVTPGFIGHSKMYMGSVKFISGDGGLARLVWMPKRLKDEMKEMINACAQRQGLGERFTDKIADESVAQSEEEVLKFLTETNHPALAMEPMF